MKFAYMRAMAYESMTAGQGLSFRKMHGLGNDFVLIDQRHEPIKLSEPLVRAIGDRHRGIGFDQLAEISPGTGADADLLFWNADGTTSAACGNATRCIADLLMREAQSNQINLRTERGVLGCRRRDDGVVEVNMGPPSLDWKDVPLAREQDTTALSLEGQPAACSMGNPHCTFFVENADGADLERIGAETEHDPLFPERTNVQIVQVLDRAHARVRVWERGVGMTLASGSSSCAVVVNAHRRGLMDRQAVLHLDGGDIEITWAQDGDVLMAGPVTYAFEGVIGSDFIAANS